MAAAVGMAAVGMAAVGVGVVAAGAGAAHPSGLRFHRYILRRPPIITRLPLTIRLQHIIRHRHTTRIRRALRILPAIMAQADRRITSNRIASRVTAARWSPIPTTAVHPMNRSPVLGDHASERTGPTVGAIGVILGAEGGGAGQQLINLLKTAIAKTFITISCRSPSSLPHAPAVRGALRSSPVASAP